MANRLSGTKSPYLLMHADNPVDWYPWSRDAFIAAQRLDRPIFISIGYYSCHWCHRMNDDCFMDSEVARLMNRAFVNVLVDREERPDVDSYYMKAAVAMNGFGGWPLNVIADQHGRPFFATTYIPKHGSMNSMGIMELVPAVERLWATDRDKLLKYSSTVIESLFRRPSEQRACDKMALQELLSSFDEEYGGFGTEPKFPPYGALMLLMLKGEAKVVSKTLYGMINGCLQDHVEHGFHRYTVDRAWLVPHFEKMLYDQALSVLCFSEAFRVIGDRLFANVAKDTFIYMTKRLLSPYGGFYSSEGSDSKDGEGGYYIIRDLDALGAQLGFDPKPMLVNIGDGYLLKRPPEGREGSLIIEAITKLRALRSRPDLDRKILTDWNSLAAACLAYAGSLLGSDEMVEVASNAFKFVISEMEANGELMHSWFNGRAEVTGMLEDYAYAIWASIELYEATLDTSYLQVALELLEAQHKKFGGSLPLSKSNEPALPAVVETEDSVLPSGNSITLYNLLRLYYITGDERLIVMYKELGKAIEPYACGIPSAHAFFYWVREIERAGPRYVIVVGERQRADAFRREFARVRSPGDVFVLREPEDGYIDKISRNARDYEAKQGKTTAYVCSYGHCSLPLYEPEDMVKELTQHGSSELA